MMFDRAATYRRQLEKEGNLVVEDEAEISEDFRCPSDYNPEALTALLYPGNGSLHSHQDGVMGWVLSLTIGNSILFSFGPSMKGSHNDRQTQVCSLLPLSAKLMSSPLPSPPPKKTGPSGLG